MSQFDGRTDIEWDWMFDVRRYVVWIEEEQNNNVMVPIVGSPATGEIINGVGRYEWYGYNASKVYRVRVQSVCNANSETLGNLSAWVFFGGRGGRVEPPAPEVPEPPSCHVDEKRKHKRGVMTTGDPCQYRK